MFDWFSKKTKEAVKVTQTTIGAHGDHWRAVLGSENPSMQEIIRREIEQADQIGQPRPGMVRMQRSHGRSPFMGVLEHNVFRTFYPVLMTARAIPVTVQEIIEWKHVRGVEAQIIGAGRDTFALNFFATDYLEQAEQYKAGGTLMVALTGLAYQVQDAEEMPSNFSDRFCGYFPCEGSRECMDYQFVGNINSIDNLAICGEPCRILDVQLVNDGDTILNLEMLVNAKHVSVPLGIGGRISGIFWLQGRLSTLENESEQQIPPVCCNPVPRSDPKQRRW